MPEIPLKLVPYGEGVTIVVCGIIRRMRFWRKDNCCFSCWKESVSPRWAVCIHCMTLWLLKQQECLMSIHQNTIEFHLEDQRSSEKNGPRNKCAVAAQNPPCHCNYRHMLRHFQGAKNAFAKTTFISWWWFGHGLYPSVDIWTLNNYQENVQYERAQEF